MKTIKLTEEKIETVFGTLYRIEAIVDIPARGIKKGDKGGFAKNDAQVSGNAWVSGDAQVSGDARVYGNAWVYGNAQVSGNAWVYGNAQVSGDAWVYGDARVDSIDAIIVLVIAMKYSVTITRTLLFIGCQMFKRSELKTITRKKAIEMGLPKEYHKAYAQMIKGAMLLVKEKK